MLEKSPYFSWVYFKVSILFKIDKTKERGFVKRHLIHDGTNDYLWKDQCYLGF